MAIALRDDDGGGGYGGGGSPGGGGAAGGGARAWLIDPTPDTLVFTLAVGVGVAIQVKEYSTADIKSTDVWALGAWNADFGYPGEVEFYASRLNWASSRSQPQTVWMSEVENYATFGASTPIEDDDAITATINSRSLNKIRDLVPMADMVVLSTGGAWKATSSEGEVLTPLTIAFRPQVARGSSPLPALMIDASAIYATDKGYQVRDLSYAFDADGYAGSDLTAFSGHLVKYRTLVDWDYQDTPYSAVFSARNDGVLLSMTYKREHQVVGWARQTTLGQFRSVVVIPEGDGHAVYAIVQRTLNGVVTQCQERMAQPTEFIYDWFGVDCGLTYDGRNTGATTFTLTGAAFDTETELTITASSAAFAPSNVGDIVVLGFGTDTLARIEITGYTSSTVVQGYALSPIDAAYQAIATTDWALAVDEITGLDHLEGMTVDVIADGAIQAQQTVASGAITLEDRAVIAHIGFAYDCDMETLEFNMPGAESIGSKRKIVRQTDVVVVQARNVRAGASFDKLEAQKSRAREVWGREPDPQAGLLEYNISATWSTTGKLCIRAGGGLPATILSLAPKIELGS